MRQRPISNQILVLMIESSDDGDEYGVIFSRLGCIIFSNYIASYRDFALVIFTEFLLALGCVINHMIDLLALRLALNLFVCWNVYSFKRERERERGGKTLYLPISVIAYQLILWPNPCICDMNFNGLVAEYLHMAPQKCSVVVEMASYVPLFVSTKDRW